jgi:HSP20 family protein
MNETTKTPAVPATTGRSLLQDNGPVSWLRGEIDRLFDDFGQPGRSLFNFPARVSGPVPAIELADGGKDYTLTAELPGLTDKDVNVELADGVLSISGEKSEEAERKDGGYLLSERRYGSFRRQVALPADADPEAIAATFKDGVLTLTIGKDQKAAARTRKIPIGS